MNCLEATCIGRDSYDYTRTTCGYDAGQIVTMEYEAPFRFTGKIRRVTVDVFGELITDTKAQEMLIKIIMKRQ